VRGSEEKELTISRYFVSKSVPKGEIHASQSRKNIVQNALPISGSSYANILSHNTNLMHGHGKVGGNC